MNWFRFFCGTPQRFLTTTISLIIGLTWMRYHPGAIHNTLAQLFAEASGPIMSLVILATVLAIVVGMLRGALGGHGRRRG